MRVTVNKNNAWCEKRDLLTTGSVGVLVELDFSDDWDGLQAFAVFESYNRSAAAPVTGETVLIPPEMFDVPFVHLMIGLYGVAEDGSVVIPTVYADLGEIRKGANLTGADNVSPPTAVLYAQIEALAKAAQAAASAAASGVYAGSVTFSVSGPTSDDPGHLIMSVTEEGVTTTTDLGPVSAWAVALDAGYTGSYDDFKELLIANAQTAYNVEAALDAVEDVTATATAAQAAASGAQTAATAAQTSATAAQTAVAGKQPQHITRQVTLPAGGGSSDANWTNITATGVKSNNTVIVTPAPASFNAWVAAGVYCSAQGNGKLSFKSSALTTAALTANVVILD